jgi:hypothetical protein
MPSKMLRVAAAFVLAASLGGQVADAHAPKVGRNGGPQTNAGPYHVEVLGDGGKLVVFVRDHSDKAVLTQDFKGTATLVIDGAARTIPLHPAGENRLEGTLPVRLPPDVKGVVRIIAGSGAAAEATFK